MRACRKDEESESELVGQAFPVLLPAYSPMSVAFYHILHIVGLIFIFAGFGALLSSESSRTAMKWHGIGLLISFVSGFAMISKLGFKMSALPTWIFIKMGLWLVLGFLPVLARKRVLAPQAVLLIAIVVGGVLAYLGNMKPAL